jgi:hypothetical protein
MLVINNYNGYSIAVSLRGEYYVMKIYELADMGSPATEFLISPAMFGEHVARVTAQEFIDAAVKERIRH